MSTDGDGIASGVDEGQGSPAVLVTADVAAGEALAFACARRGVNVVVTDVERVDPASAEVVLVDLRSSGAASLADLSRLRRNGARRMIGIGGVPEGAVDQHLDDWVALDESLDELTAAITDTAAITNSVLTRRRPAAESMGDLERLTPREREVMALLLAGLGVESIGTRLGIAANTVRTHVQNVLAKLDVNSRAEAAAWALRAGLEPVDVGAGAVR
jgi:DNA-binding NarL/FixJ family response regulator